LKSIVEAAIRHEKARLGVIKHLSRDRFTEWTTIGQGMYGRVYRAIDTARDNLVVIKECTWVSFNSLCTLNFIPTFH